MQNAQNDSGGWDKAAIGALFDLKTGLLDRRVFCDEALYRTRDGADFCTRLELHVP